MNKLNFDINVIFKKEIDDQISVNCLDFLKGVPLIVIFVLISCPN
jgi:hypothetical protein